MPGDAVTGLMGKHPGYGDFIATGISTQTEAALTGWLDPVLAALRDQLGNDWAGFWDSAQDLRFWIGRGIFGRTLAGVMRPSRDRVGRRYPLLILAEAVAVPPPVRDPDQGLWRALATHLDRMQPGQGARALLVGLPGGFPAETPEAAAAGPTIWAHRPDGDLAALLAAAGPVEAARAELSRSHFWAPATPGRAAVWLAETGLPGAGALGWLLAGMPAEDAAPAAPTGLQYGGAEPPDPAQEGPQDAP